MLGLVEATWSTGGNRPLTLTLVLPLTIPLAWRRRHPAAVILVVTTVLVVQLPWASVRLFDQTFTGFVCLLLASYAVGRHGQAPWAVPVLAGCALGVAAALGWYDRSLGTFVLGVVFVVAPAAIGRVVAVRSALRDLLERQADMLREYAEVVERTRVAEVRGRIAGEVQDLVSHRVHEMVDRSEAARRLAQRDPSGAAELVATVEVDGRAALDEMRTMLGVLRTADLAGSGSGSLSAGADLSGEGNRPGYLPLRRFELLLIAAFTVLVVGEMLASPGALPIVSLTMLGPLFAFGVGTRMSGRAAVVGLGIALVAVAVVTPLVGEGWGDYVFPSVLVFLSWLGGRLVREQNDLVERSRCRAIALERSAQVRAGAAVTEERLRLARELHDVLAHTLMVMVVQAGAARRSLESGRVGATEALCIVEETGRDASMELRRLLALVDPDGGSTAEDPDGTPGLSDLRSLVARARAAGVDAELVVDGEPVPISGGLALALFRVAQEAVTNVIRHSAARHVVLRLRYEPQQIQLEVRDDGCSVTDAPGGTSGNGLTGMRERARIYGGELSAGPSPGHGFVVTATFPLVGLFEGQPA